MKRFTVAAISAIALTLPTTVVMAQSSTMVKDVLVCAGVKAEKNARSQAGVCQQLRLARSIIGTMQTIEDSEIEPQR